MVYWAWGVPNNLLHHILALSWRSWKVIINHRIGTATQLRWDVQKVGLMPAELQVLGKHTHLRLVCIGSVNIYRPCRILNIACPNSGALLKYQYKYVNVLVGGVPPIFFEKTIISHIPENLLLSEHQDAFPLYHCCRICLDCFYCLGCWFQMFWLVPTSPLDLPSWGSPNEAWQRMFYMTIRVSVI